MEEIKLDTIAEALAEIKAGKMIVVVDDEDRENEGDLVMAARHITPEAVNFMATYAKGLICTPISEERANELGLDLMVSNNTTLHETPFTISIDLLGSGNTTGISAQDRSRTIYALIDSKTQPEQLSKPGHIFPLRARKEGVLRRAGHTEATIDLCRLAGLEPVGVCVEVLNEDGSMARLPELRKFADKHQLKLVTIKDLITYRLGTESLIKKIETIQLPTIHGDFELTAYQQLSDGQLHLVIHKGSWSPETPILVRVHSSCMTGDIFGSCRCDCGEQLHQAMKKIQEEGSGLIVYMNQEGRGIGLENKLKAYKLQEGGVDTVDANIALGFKMDERDYGIGAQILRDMQVCKMRLMSNNPTKRAGLIGYGLEIVENVPLVVKPNPHNMNYLKTKQERMGHSF
ncbi:MAG: bifunctional 3,4-dihydroxy-2-butanone-4-phosphate synthase/GTP cyclohydrolase II [Sphingobacteriia bacterium]|nr:bifunctional 3,4-dihydroxy-2-butanone-4-phosphate synthase/GTP cyclohydrolase II [Sphingobacteriia bacterium]